MNKEGSIILLHHNPDDCTALCKSLTSSVYNNKCIGFTESGEATQYIVDNLSDIFILLQSTATPSVEIPNTRNMVYMHETFDTTKLPYTLLMLTQPKVTEKQYTFIHSYYIPDTVEKVTTTLSQVVAFWRDHMFPPKVMPVV
ncbi:hypothetical protein ACLI09_14660 [Flavobacterium sp. RHBU_24]|uniref:hypothetical protein n=1 Tax=Flavobacterium sp. RHBU_24 TaxID=3391185 RepID=UPI0039846E42